VVDHSLIEEARHALSKYLPKEIDDNDFSEATEKEFEEASGPPVAPVKQQARPFYFIVTDSALLFGFVPVVLFNAAVNLTTANYGNTSPTVTSLYPNMTYGGLLAVTISQPFRISSMRMQCPDTYSLQQPIAFTETQYHGDANTVSYVPNIALDQPYTAALSVPSREIIHSTKLVSFNMYNNNPVTFKIFPQYISDYSRTLERKRLIKELKDRPPFLLPDNLILE